MTSESGEVLDVAALFGIEARRFRRGRRCGAVDRPLTSNRMPTTNWTWITRWREAEIDDDEDEQPTAVVDATRQNPTDADECRVRRARVARGLT